MKDRSYIYRTQQSRAAKAQNILRCHRITDAEAAWPYPADTRSIWQILKDFWARFYRWWWAQ